ncbi:dihydrolipoyllysine-residue acetyltransferase component of pyruvate dehydrogenase complex, mitochondrial isoform X1 [Lates japonicus]|uniref:Dihydrolipoyllysine-residue acetyltransferase component of pyruvate dehydrogenase complex, mitochondrial isoform X1 n=1 Tax=Lates japonicus TaxID=270547 RepID=A0AAD3NHW6_LATJO|nr:dihydrolipoyllysine-residue acetyltransferase component of pyruvate dehydrogenase complex, mitochondrial isoform X1 [Lates japonicus]
MLEECYLRRSWSRGTRDVNAVGNLITVDSWGNGVGLIKPAVPRRHPATAPPPPPAAAAAPPAAPAASYPTHESFEVQEEDIAQNLVSRGTRASPGAPLCICAESDIAAFKDYVKLGSRVSSSTPAPAQQPAAAPVAAAPLHQAAAQDPEGVCYASPLAKKLAAEGLTWHRSAALVLMGVSPGKTLRLCSTKACLVVAAAPTPAAAAPACYSTGTFTDIPISNIRKALACLKVPDATLYWMDTVVRQNHVVDMEYSSEGTASGLITPIVLAPHTKGLGCRSAPMCQLWLPKQERANCSLMSSRYNRYRHH